MARLYVSVNSCG